MASIVSNVINRVVSECTMVGVVLFITRFGLYWPYYIEEVEGELYSTLVTYCIFRFMILLLNPFVQLLSGRPGFFLTASICVISLIFSVDAKVREKLFNGFFEHSMVKDLSTQLDTLWSVVDTGNENINLILDEAFVYLGGEGYVSYKKEGNTALVASIWFMILSLPIYYLKWVLVFLKAIVGVFRKNETPPGYECVDGVCRKVETVEKKSATSSTGNSVKKGVKNGKDVTSPSKKNKKKSK